ncbi:hypothetical protein D3C85_1387540 [compost metagenome]
MHEQEVRLLHGHHLEERTGDALLILDRLIRVRRRGEEDRDGPFALGLYKLLREKRGRVLFHINPTAPGFAAAEQGYWHLPHVAIGARKSTARVRVERVCISF